ncbi:MAG: formate dehydrogenase subunit gamma [Hyphomicrobiales bacterium]|nr:formate dehydrogenase subunit gamma [Hyphomicrobiales bacterium]MCP5371810.1 formate dehydrogenase subunit gamma [Hyphomicrobiales bacterium]
MILSRLWRGLAGLALVLVVAWAAAAAWTGALDLDHGAWAQNQGTVPGNVHGTSNDADFWRQIRRGMPGKVSIPNPQAGVLVQSQGDNWRAIRNGPVLFYGGILLLASLAAIALFFLIRGRIRIEGGRSGRTIPRFSLTERIIHWFVACTFILLGITGLFLLFGKHLLVPIIGKAAFGVIANASLQCHNLFGPLFIVGIVAMFLVYLRDNGFNMVDVRWALKGGVLNSGHTSSEKNNAGEKIWFWMAVLGGLSLSVSGLMMEFPWWPTLELLQWANIAHVVVALGLIAVAFGHIYIGTLGVEGALEGMTKGEVDVNWGLEHHDLWAEEVLAEIEASRTKRRSDGYVPGVQQGSPAE